MGNPSKNYDKQIKAILDRLKSLEDKLFPPGPPGPPGPTPDPTNPPTKPTEGKVKEWGANKDPSTWSVVKMRDNPALSKVVDDQAINVATDFTSDATAQQYIDYYKYIQGNPIPPPPPPDPTHVCPSGQHWDEATQTCIDNSVTPPPPVGGGTVDAEGIQMLYQDDPSKKEQQWFSKTGDKSRLDGKGARKDLGNGVIQVTPDPGTHPASARVYIRTTNPKAFDEPSQMKIGTDWAKMAQLGYMLDPFDYCDAEVSGYYKITKSSADDQFTFYWRGGAHSHNPFPAQCVACCNKVQIEMKDVSPRSAKEYHHDQSPSGYAWNDTVKAKFDLKSELGGSMVGKMLGQKMCMYNVKDSTGKVTSVVMQLWVDTASKDLPKPDLSKQNWRLFVEYIDDGTNWPDPENPAYIKECNAKKGQMITWGGPYIALRLDDNIWEMHNLSVRPIVPVRVS